MEVKCVCIAQCVYGNGTVVNEFTERFIKSSNRIKTQNNVKKVLVKG